MGLAVIDIDGVVADVRHRLHHLDGRGRRSWSAFFAAAANDPLLPEGAELAHLLAREHAIVWLTGRPERLRGTTAAWLQQHDLPEGRLEMRPDDDRRPAVVFKLGVLRRLADDVVTAVVDDDPAVIAAARGAGYPAELADWVPREGADLSLLREAQERLGRT